MKFSSVKYYPFECIDFDTGKDNLNLCLLNSQAMPDIPSIKRERRKSAPVENVPQLAYREDNESRRRASGISDRWHILRACESHCLLFPKRNRRQRIGIGRVNHHVSFFPNIFRALERSFPARHSKALFAWTTFCYWVQIPLDISLRSLCEAFTERECPLRKLEAVKRRALRSKRSKDRKYAKEWWWSRLLSILRPVGSSRVKFWFFTTRLQSVPVIKRWVSSRISSKQKTMQNKSKTQSSFEIFHTLLSILVHCGSIRQTASILSMSQDCLRTGDKALVHFRFIKHPEYIKPGQRMVFREGRTKAVGNVLRLIPYSSSSNSQISRSGKPNKSGQQQGRGQPATNYYVSFFLPSQKKFPEEEFSNKKKISISTFRHFSLSADNRSFGSERKFRVASSKAWKHAAENELGTEHENGTRTKRWWKISQFGDHQCSATLRAKSTGQDLKRSR